MFHKVHLVAIFTSWQVPSLKHPHIHKLSIDRLNAEMVLMALGDAHRQFHSFSELQSELLSYSPCLLLTTNLLGPFLVGHWPGRASNQATTSR